MPYEPRDLIDSRIRIHDGNQLELKLDYAIDPGARKNRYQVEAYFFVPRSLGLDAHTYGRAQFYGDVQAYIRFKTPRVSIASLLLPGNELSPLLRAREILENDEGSGRTIDRARLTHEMQLLACLVRAYVRDCTVGFRKRIAAIERRRQASPVMVRDVAVGLGALLDEVESLYARFRGLRPEFLHPSRARWIGELYGITDEYLSLNIEAYLTATIATIDQNARTLGSLREIRERLAARVLAEQDHRRGAGYPGVLDPGTDDGGYVYRLGKLKKFASSVLFLEIHRQQGAKRLGQFLAGVAAGVAMLFSTIAALWSQDAYGINSAPFVLILVVSYIFKDRIKEWLRTYFSNQLTRKLYDYNLRIYDPYKRIEVGRCKESFTYLDPDRLPEEIARARHIDRQDPLDEDRGLEVVMKYVKDVTIRSSKILDVHGRLHDINDIIRFNVTSFLQRMDDPVREIFRFDGDSDAVEVLRCPKTYHLNLVLVLRAKTQEVSRLRFRVVLDRKGIRNLQEIVVPGALTETAPDSRPAMPRPRAAVESPEPSGWHPASGHRNAAAEVRAITETQQLPPRTSIRSEVDLLRPR